MPCQFRSICVTVYEEILIIILYACVFNLVLKAMRHLEGVHNPLPHSPYKFYVLIETTGSDESYDK